MDGHSAPAKWIPGVSSVTEELRIWNVVLDDDPTGTQAVTGVPILTQGWTDEDLIWAAQQPGRMTFVLTNSRAVDEKAAAAMTFDLVRRASLVATRLGLTIRVVSRSDSTLRGHFSAEIAAAHGALRAAGGRSHGTIFVPAFLEAGRVTIDDVQWVRTGAGYIPAAQTEFARDATFGYTEENLILWVQERMPESDTRVTSVSLADLRADDGAARASACIAAMGSNDVLVANAELPNDLNVLMAGLLMQEGEGRRPVIRTGPSFVRLCAGQEQSDPVTGNALRVNASHGLLVIGSHTDLTNTQVEAAFDSHPLRIVELDAAICVTGSADEYAAEVSRCVDEVLSALDADDVALRTSRAVLTEGRTTPLLTSKAVADAVVEVVTRVALARQLGFLVAKGGITSSDLVVRALQAQRARIIGQMLPGTVPVWELLDGHAPGLAYIVFPGNVGGPDALAEVLAKLRRSSD